MISRSLIIAICALAFKLSACSSEARSAEAAPNSAECGGHGNLHDDHCDCDSGFEIAFDDKELCVAAATSSDAGAKQVRAGRVLVSDGEEGRVVVVDLAQGKAIASLATQGTARVYASSDGARGFAVQSTADAIQVVEPGIVYEDHGDHLDVETSEPSLFSELVVSCLRPIHFTPHDGYNAAFCDGDGILHVFNDEAGVDTFEVEPFDSGRPHHGVGLVAFDSVIVSVPNLDDEEDALPVGIRVLDFAGREQAVFNECPGLHGETATDDAVCFGCSDGVLCLQSVDGEVTSVKLPNPADAPEGVRVGTLTSTGAAGIILGNWGNDLVRVDLESGALIPLAISQPYLSFALAFDGEHALVLTESGELRKIEVRSGDAVASVAIFPKFEVDTGHGQLRPTFVLGHEHAYVIDPRHPELYEVDLETLELSDRVIELDAGQYHSLAIVGLPPEGHAH